MSDTVKKTLFVDGKEVEFNDEKNLLEVIRKAGFEVPTLCYRPELRSFGACRMCVVEIEGRGIQSSCTMPPEPNLKVHVNSEAVRKVRKSVLELLLANHNRECTMCPRSHNCELQALANKYEVREIKFPNREKLLPIDDSNPALVRDPNKCILCGACVRACSEHQGLEILGFTHRGSRTLVSPALGKKLGEVDCVYCGQCAAVCPTAAITIKSDVQKVRDMIADKESTVVCQIAPSVRVAAGEEFGLNPGDNVIGKLAAALRMVGFDKVYDTNFAADVTIMEEGTEFIDRLTNGGVLPLFTSCCPAWIRYIETQHPELLPHVSTTRSPEAIFGSAIKDIAVNRDGFARDKYKIVSFMPCTSKKTECKRPEFAVDGIPDVDCVLTTQELVALIKGSGIDLKTVEPEELDMPFGLYTGAATIFGASGGVAEAALRTVSEIVTGKPIEHVDIKETRGLNRCKELTVELNGQKIKVVIVNTLREAEKMLQKVIDGTADFQMLEVMACPGGCVGGGGQPISCNNPAKKNQRADGLYKEDSSLPYRKSHENPAVKKFYEEWFEKPGSHKAHELLHTSYINRFETCYKNTK